MSSELCVFWSNSKDNYELSNLFDSYIKVGDHVYPSVEHAFQAMQHEDPIPWTTQGEFANWDFVLPRVNEGRKTPITGKNLRKKFMTGALAKMVADRPLMFQLKRKLLQYPYSEDIWMPLFEAKFCAPPPEGSGHAEGELLGILLKTSGTLLLKDPNATDETVLAGRFDRVLNRVVGQNKMGQMLTKFRDSKRPKRKAEVIQGETLSFDQVLNKKFKEAQEKGMVIELDQDDFLPHNWGELTIEQKLTHAMEKNWTLQQCAKYIQMPKNPMYTPVAPEASSSSKSKPPKIFSDSSDESISESSSDSEPSSPPYQPSSPPYQPSSPGPSAPPPLELPPPAITLEQLHTGLQSASGIVLTWSHSVESGNYVNPVGTKGRGFTFLDLHKIRQLVNLRTHMFRVYGDFHEKIVGHVLVVRNFLSETTRTKMVSEIKALPNYDTKGWFRGKCLNKSRWNTQLTDRDIQGNIPEPDKSKRMSSENSFDKAPWSLGIRNKFSAWGAEGLDTQDLKAEANIYGITKPGGKPPKMAPGIGPHVDGERNTVIATNLMGQRQLCLGAYHNAMPIGPRTQITINPGDMYIFDTIAAGTSMRGTHIRHWASGGRGDMAYIDKIEKELVKKVKGMKAPLSEAAKFILENNYQDTHCLAD